MLSHIGINFMVIVTLAVMGAMALSIFWYSPKVFGDRWLNLTGISATSYKDGKRRMLYTLFAYFAIALTLFTILIWAGATNAKAGIVVGLWVGLGLSTMTLLIPCIWEGKPSKLFLINGGITLVNTVFMSAVMAHLIGKFYL